MAMDNGLSIGDALALTKNNDENGGFLSGGAGGILALIIVFILLFGGGSAWGGCGNGAVGTYATQADIQRGFDTNQIINKLDGISNGLCDGFYAMNTTMLNGFNGVSGGITELGYQMKDCCCTTNRNIDAVRYENAQNTCEITTAIHAEGEATRALINANTMQDLRDKLEDRDRELQTANFQLSQQAQSANLVNLLRPFPIPSYITCSPYTTPTNVYGYSNCNGCGTVA